MTGIGDLRPIVVAHRGGAAEAPENSLEAFERAIRLGYPAVEFDVRMSRDGAPVVVHDERIKVSPGAPFRAVADLPGTDLTRFPTLDDVLGLRWGSTVLMAEVKPTAQDQELGQLAARAVVAHGLAPQAVLASFSAGVLRAASQAAPHLRIMALLDDPTAAPQFEGLTLFGWGIDIAILDRGPMESWKAGSREPGSRTQAKRRCWGGGPGSRTQAKRRCWGGEVWTWTVKDLGQMRRALALGVDGLITDIPGEVLKHLQP